MGELFALSPEELTAVRLSLRVAVWATLVSLPLGVLGAVVLARGRFPGKALLDGVVHLPLVLPPVVTGYALLLLFGRNGPLGKLFAEQLGIVFAFRWTGGALAPSPAWVFAVVTLPLILPGIIAGMILSFARSLGEFGATITFVSNIP